MTFTNILFHGFLSSQSSDFHNFASIFVAFMKWIYGHPPHSNIQEILPLRLFGEWARRPCRWRKFPISWLSETSLMAQQVKNPPARQEAEKTQVLILGWEDSLEEGVATHSSILAWRMPWTEEPGRLQSMGSQRARHDWSDLAYMHTWLVRAAGIVRKPYDCVEPKQTPSFFFNL